MQHVNRYSDSELNGDGVYGCPRCRYSLYSASTGHDRQKHFEMQMDFGNMHLADDHYSAAPGRYTEQSYSRPNLPLYVEKVQESMRDDAYQRHGACFPTVMPLHDHVYESRQRKRSQIVSNAMTHDLYRPDQSRYMLEEVGSEPLRTRGRGCSIQETSEGYLRPRTHHEGLSLTLPRVTAPARHHRNSLTRTYPMWHPSVAAASESMGSSREARNLLPAGSDLQGIGSRIPSTNRSLSDLSCRADAGTDSQAETTGAAPSSPKPKYMDAARQDHDTRLTGYIYTESQVSKTHTEHKRSHSFDSSSCIAGDKADRGSDTVVGRPRKKVRYAEPARDISVQNRADGAESFQVKTKDLL